jgi:hypothetical protein|tara:strand:+ start:321 stop:587 length:267 start_codon:yes stop_codon:yes gene_type:complete
MDKKVKNLSKEELTILQTLQQEFNTVKMQLGDTILQQAQLMKKVEEVKQKFASKEVELMEVYGKDAVINLENGEVTQKEDEAKLEQVK